MNVKDFIRNWRSRRSSTRRAITAGKDSKTTRNDDERKRNNSTFTFRWDGVR